jgi:hypothetical protein
VSTWFNSFLRHVLFPSLFVLWAITAWGSPCSREILAVRAAPLHVDGVLEPDWLTGAVADSFVQTNPVEGMPASLKTRVYLLYDDNALYVAFLCLDAAPDSIAGRVQRRDNADRSDMVELDLDSFHDLRNGYSFALTAAGVQTDATIANENSTDLSWDGIWQSAVGRTDSGWVAEMRIPFQSLRHGGPRADGWGINLGRYIYRRQETDYWQPVSRERGLRMSEIGTLKGLANIASAAHTELLPHAVGRFDALHHRSWQSKNEWQNLGGYVKVVPGSSWTVDLALQPDFAQVDVDDEVINLSDYPVFLPEKRPFFIESKSLFDAAPISLFYTRRITDPDYGGRLNMQGERVRASVLAAKNRGPAGEDQDAAAGRVAWNVGRVSTLGLTSTYLEQKGFHAHAASADARIRWGIRNRLHLAVAGVDRSGLRAQPVEGYAGVSNDLNFCVIEASTNFRGVDYDINDLGWDTYSNVFNQHLGASKNYYPKASIFESVQWTAGAIRRTLTDGSHPDLVVSGNTYLYTHSGWGIGANGEVGSWNERRYGSGTYRDNFLSHGYGTFTPHRYDDLDCSAFVQSDMRLPVEGYVQVGGGKLREGHHALFEAKLTAKPRANLDVSAQLSWEHIYGLSVSTLNDLGFSPSIVGDTLSDLRVWQLHAHYSPLLNVTLRGTLQWVEYYKALYTNIMLAWNWRAGSWFYIVYDQGPPDWSRRAYPVRYQFPGDRTLRLKATYFFTVG